MTFNEIEVYQTKLAPFKISDQENFDGIMFFSPSAVESYFSNNKIKKEICFCVGNTTAAALEELKIKNIVVADLPTVEDTIIAVFEHFNPEIIEPEAQN